MSKQPNQVSRRLPHGRILAVVAVAVLGVTAGTVGIDQESEPGQTTIVARFADASPLLVGNEVKVSGVKVGQVAAMDVRGGKASVVLSLESEALPVHTDARATIRPVSLLGERYVELDRGSPDAPVLGDGDVLPMRQTGAQADLDEVLNTVDEPTGRSLAALVTMLGEGIRGNGGNADATIRALESSMNDTTALSGVLRDQNQLLGSLVDKLQPVASALAADQGANLDRLVASARKLTAATATKRRELTETLRRLPETLATARATLAQLTGTAAETTPTLAAIRPTTDDLAAISAEIQRFADAADPALAHANPVLEHAQRLLDEARPVVDQLRQAGPDLRSAVGDLRPVVGELTANLGNVLGFIRNWALTTNGRDGISHYFRAMLVVSPDLLGAAVPTPNGAPPAQQQGPPSERPPETSPQPDRAPLPLPQVPGLTGDGGILGGLLSTEQDPKAGVTGLDPQQEQGLVQFLIGGGGR